MKQCTRWAGIYLRIQAIKLNKLLHSGSSAYPRKDNKVCGDLFGEPIAQSKISELPGKSMGFCLEREENLYLEYTHQGGHIVVVFIKQIEKANEVLVLFYFFCLSVLSFCLLFLSLVSSLFYPTLSISLGEYNRHIRQ